jgi:hypothetical protein
MSIESHLTFLDRNLGSDRTGVADVLNELHTTSGPEIRRTNLTWRHLKTPSHDVLKHLSTDSRQANTGFANCSEILF